MDKDETTQSKLYVRLIEFFSEFVFFLYREERRDEIDHGWHEADEFFKAFAPNNLYPKIASRREDIDSSEEDDDKGSSETPSGWSLIFIKSHINLIINVSMTLFHT